MTLQQRINALVALGEHLRQPFGEELQRLIVKAKIDNAWFTPESSEQALREIADAFLNREALEQWVKNYAIADTTERKTVGLILAGNIPLVGFHDILSVFVAGHQAKVKLSDKDNHLIPYLIRFLNQYDFATLPYFELLTTEYLKKFDAIIATGSNNSARYFEAYFGKYPNIIRKNRNAVAVLNCTETNEEMTALGHDIFRYFGLGCRNVSKIYLPKGYNFEPLLESLHEFREIVLHDRYKNNFDHNFALLILNRVDYKSNGCILMSENRGIASPIACVYYEYYDTLEQIEKDLLEKKDEIQLVVTKEKIENLPTFAFGEAQKPSLLDYADGVDTLQFLLTI